MVNMKSFVIDEPAEYVASCLELAILLEVSAYPKPGNIHRTADFEKTKYEHFLVSAIAAAPFFRLAAEQGIKISERRISYQEVGIGNIIRRAVVNIGAWQKGGNTLLGSVILLSPIAVAAGMALNKHPFSVARLRKELKTVTEATTPKDTLAVFDAIKAAEPSGLGRVPKLDVNDAASRERIKDDHVTLHEVFKIASTYDSIASEWVNNYPIAFDLGYPYFIQQLESTGDINIATVHTFLKILSRVPDTLIARKRGVAEARRVSREAQQVLANGGLTTRSGRTRLQDFDEKLRDPHHTLNPGTTADLVQAVVGIALLEGYRP
jgi:triphosphoribosyl-dephospho-CoA synthase